MTIFTKQRLIDLISKSSVLRATGDLGEHLANGEMIFWGLTRQGIITILSNNKPPIDGYRVSINTDPDTYTFIMTNHLRIIITLRKEAK